jgi:HPt (histidine-containing phosphotransfer) domain-containing protein
MPAPAETAVETVIEVASGGEGGDAGGQDDELSQFLPRFIARLPQQVAELHALLHKQSIEELAKAVHQIKGTAGMYGFGEISDVAARAEAMAKSKQQACDLELLTREVEEMIEMIRRIEGYDASREDEHAQT